MLVTNALQTNLESYFRLEMEKKVVNRLTCGEYNQYYETLVLRAYSIN